MPNMKKYINLYLYLYFFAILFLSACSKKEQDFSDKLKGKWKVSEIRVNSDSVYTDLSKGIHEIEFFGGKRAYTASFLGVYSINYFDENLKDVSDTFRYDIKNDQLAITSVKMVASSNPTIKLIRYRYKIETLNGSELYLNRTPFDTTNAYLKAIK
jgi:hypothetical protein